MRRAILVLTTLSLASALLVPSGATPLFSGSTDRITDSVEVHPSDSPDGKYAYIDNGSGELVIDISPTNPNLERVEGVSPDSVTTFDDVFRIHYSGSQLADVWLSHESDAVTFYAQGEPIESEASNVTLGPNESVAVGLRVDTTGETTEGLIDGFTINAKVVEPESGLASPAVRASSAGPPSLTIDVTESSAESRTVDVRNLAAGDTVDIDLERMRVVGENVTLDGARFISTDAGDVDFSVTRRATAPESVRPIAPETDIDPRGYFAVEHSIDDSAVENVLFEFSARKTYLNRTDTERRDVRLLRWGGNGWQVLDPRVTNETGERVSFVADSPGLSTFAVGVEAPRFVTTGATVSSNTTLPNEPVTVRATVANYGAATGGTNVTLTAANESRQDRRVTLSPNETTEVAFEVGPSVAGEYPLSVDGTPIDTLVVEESTPTDPRSGHVGSASLAPTALPTMPPNLVSTPTTTETPTQSTARKSPRPPASETAGFGDLPLVGVTLVMLLSGTELVVLWRRRVQ